MESELYKVGDSRVLILQGFQFLSVGLRQTAPGDGSIGDDVPQERGINEQFNAEGEETTTAE